MRYCQITLLILMQLLSVALTLDGGLDWTRLGAATPVCPPRARVVYSLAYMLQGC